MSMSIQICVHECVRVSVRRGGREVGTVHIWLTVVTRYHGDIRDRKQTRGGIQKDL